MLPLTDDNDKPATETTGNKTATICHREGRDVLHVPDGDLKLLCVAIVWQ